MTKREFSEPNEGHQQRKPTANIKLDKRLAALPYNWGNTLTFSSQHLTHSPNQCDERKKRGGQIGKEEIKLFLLVDNMIAYVKKISRNPHKNLL